MRWLSPPDSVPEARDAALEPAPQAMVTEEPPRLAVEPAGPLADEPSAGEAAAAPAAAPVPPPEPAMAAVLPATASPNSTPGCAPALDALGLCDHPQR